MRSSKFTPHMMRTFLTLGLVLLVAILLGLAAESWLDDTQAAPESEQPESASVFDVWLQPVYLALASIRMALPVAGILIAIPLVALRLVSKLYAVKDPREAHEALNRFVFGRLTRRPFLVIKDGKVAYGKDSFSERVGGPATLIIYNDTAVVTEQYGQAKRILGAGIHDAERFEKPWEVIDLRPQYWVFPVFALTKEGIPISCEADISFKIDDEPRDAGWKAHTEEPYPFAEDAVFRAATGKWIREPDRPDPRMTWAGRVVIGFTEGTLRDILAEYRLDWLIAPPQPGQEHPREVIRQRLEEGLRKSVGSVGAKLLRVEIGKIEVKARDEETTKQLSEIISQKWIEAWHADWEARELAIRAEGEAELLRMDMARIQAQVEMVVTLTEALQSVITSPEAVEPYLLALRFVEALRWMSYNAYAREFMPPEAMRTLELLQKQLGTGAGISGDKEMRPLSEGP